MQQFTLPNHEIITAPEPDHIDTGGHCYVNVYYPHHHDRPEGRTIVVGFVDEYGEENDCEFVNEYECLDDYHESEPPITEWRADGAFCEGCNASASFDDIGTVCTNCRRSMVVEIWLKGYPQQSLFSTQ